VWALISTPLNGDNTTLSNGGIIQGKSGVLAIEGFYTPRGAAWLAGKARELTGRWPTHVVLTHYHSDHANGIAGYVTPENSPRIRATSRTRGLVEERNTPPDEARSAALDGAILLSPSENSTIDLGGVTARVVPRSGHTESDVSIELDEKGIVFCGDLFWNSMFPNYVDAIPSRLSESVRAIRGEGKTIYVPGHGATGDSASFDRYTSMIDEVERAARQAHDKGQSAKDAAAVFKLPASLGEWTLFGRGFFERAFTAWYRELD
jgi:glyoxylase-like metal-dependent hydrolase (beta-lactamase superfamily II)